MSVGRIAKIVRALDVGFAHEMELADIPRSSLTFAVRETANGAVILDASLVIPRDKADALAALVEKHEPEIDAEHH